MSILVAMTTVTKSYSHYLYSQPTFIIASILSHSTDSNAQLNTYIYSHVHPQKLLPLQKCHYLKVVVNEKGCHAPSLLQAKYSTPMLHVPTHTMKAYRRRE
jgi:hypothetical protein